MIQNNTSNLEVNSHARNLSPTAHIGFWYFENYIGEVKVNFHEKANPVKLAFDKLAQQLRMLNQQSKLARLKSGLCRFKIYD